jgi:NADPH-dependent glutamate synthase beta subunit-like oxidoreductase
VGDAFQTSRGGVFACGDAVSGPATVIEAVAQGNLVSVAVDHWLKTGEYRRPKYETERVDVVQLYNLDEYANATRPRVPELPLVDRTGAFTEVELGYDERTTREEAKRCLRCDLEWLDYMKLPQPNGGLVAETASPSGDVLLKARPLQG